MNSDELREVYCDDGCQEVRWKAADELDRLSTEYRELARVAKWLLDELSHQPPLVPDFYGLEAAAQLRELVLREQGNE